MMRTWSKLKNRFLPNLEFEVDDPTLALALQLGWIEKFLGKYQFTDKGQEEFAAYIKEHCADIRARN